MMIMIIIIYPWKSSRGDRGTSATPPFVPELHLKVKKRRFYVFELSAAPNCEIHPFKALESLPAGSGPKIAFSNKENDDSPIQGLSLIHI